MYNKCFSLNNIEIEYLQYMKLIMKSKHQAKDLTRKKLSQNSTNE